MGTRIVRLLLVAVVCCAGVSPCGYAEEDAAETRRLLRVVRKTGDPEAWSTAVRTLKEGTPETRQALHALLVVLARERHRAWTKAARAVDALAERGGEGLRGGKPRATWEAAKNHANEWIFDEEKFPVPSQTVITGPMEGYPQAKARGDEAVKAWAALARALDQAVGPALKLKPKKARGIEQAWRESEAAWRQVAAELAEEDRSGYGRPEVDPLAWLLLGLGLGEFADVADAYRDEPAGWRRLCLFHAY